MSRNEGIDRRDALWLVQQRCVSAIGHFDMREIGFLTDHACDGRSAQETLPCKVRARHGAGPSDKFDKEAHIKIPQQ